MKMDINSQNLILENEHSLKQRIIIFSSLVGASILWVLFFDPLFISALRFHALPNDPGPGLLFKHIFVFGMSDCLFCLACLRILTHYKIFKKVSWAVTKDSIFQGMLWGMPVIAFAVSQWLYYGLNFQFRIDHQSIAGNMFSNFYEEIIFRAFWLPLFYYLFRNIRPAIFFPSVLFALVHYKYPPFLQFTVFIGGLCFAVSYVRSGTIFAPWLAHQLVDTVADAIFKL